jgi:NO-binding membrane sensor protein with MHYT domain
MTGVYNIQLVVLSLIVAIIASYTALELAGRVSQKQGKSSWTWLFGGAVFRHADIGPGRSHD